MSLLLSYILYIKQTLRSVRVGKIPPPALLTYPNNSLLSLEAREEHQITKTLKSRKVDMPAGLTSTEFSASVVVFICPPTNKNEARPRKRAGKEKWACGSPSLDYLG